MDNIRVKIKEKDVLYPEFWHLLSAGYGDHQVLCNGMFFGSGASDADFEVKQVERGGITCPECLRLVRSYKAVRL